MGVIVLAWMFGEGILFWRWGKAGAPPPPGAVAVSSGYFALLAAVATWQPARTAATLVAVGVDVAVVLQVLPGTKTQQSTGWPPSVYTGPGIFPGGRNTAGPGGGGIGGVAAAAGQAAQGAGAGLGGALTGGTQAGQGFGAGLGGALTGGAGGPS